MEGLIPYIYRALKRRRSRRYYRSLSAGGASRWSALPGTELRFLRPPAIQLGSLGEEQQHAAGHRHRRHRSLQEFRSGELFSPESVAGRSFAKGTMGDWFGGGGGRGRGMFSCITGGGS